MHVGEVSYAEGAAVELQLRHSLERRIAPMIRTCRWVVVMMLKLCTNSEMRQKDYQFLRKSATQGFKRVVSLNKGLLYPTSP